jgi:hypothetical protein
LKELSIEKSYIILELFPAIACSFSTLFQKLLGAIRAKDGYNKIE